MFWVDDDFVTVADLMAMDAEVQAVAETESIVLEGPGGVIRRAKSMAEQTLSRFMSFANFSPNDLTFRDVNFPITAPEFRYNYAGFAQIVVSGESWSHWSAIKNYVVARTLEEFYRMASNKNADRYSDRHEGMKEQRMGEFWPNFKRRGLPIHFNPLVAPGAVMERCGTFAEKNVGTTAGPGTSTSALDFAITWVGSLYAPPVPPAYDPKLKQNQESYRSARVNLQLVSAAVAQVTISGLNSPNGTQPAFTQSSCRYSPGVAVGWNVWCGDPNDPDLVMYKQNTSGPVPLSTTSWALPGDPVLSGEVLDLGQYEQVVLEVRSQIQCC